MKEIKQAETLESKTLFYYFKWKNELSILVCKIWIKIKTYKLTRFNISVIETNPYFFPTSEKYTYILKLASVRIPNLNKNNKIKTEVQHACMYTTANHWLALHVTDDIVSGGNYRTLYITIKGLQYDLKQSLFFLLDYKLDLYGISLNEYFGCIACTMQWLTTYLDYSFE